MMKKSNLKRKWLSMLAAATVGGTMFGLGGCDPAVRDAMLTGLESTSNALADTMITAFFVSLEDDDSSSSSSSSTSLTTP